MSPLLRSAGALLLALALVPPAAADPKLVRKVPPEFPEEATRRNITDGTLKARLTIDGQGAVTAVQIVDAVPPKAKVFNDAAVAALSKWRFEPSGKGESVEIKLVFAQE